MSNDADAALLAAVLASPDDDGPRLVYADSLSARGDPLGEFIALQCRLAAAHDDEARRKLRIAENKLLKAHEASWTADFFTVAVSTLWRRVKVAFHRGFLEEATLPLETLDELDALFDVAPFLRRLRFDSALFGVHTVPPPTLEGRLDAERLKRLHSLDFRIPAGGDAAAIAIGRCPHLTGLRELRLEATVWPAPERPEPAFSGPPETHRLTATGAKALASSPHLKRLRRVELVGNDLGPAGAKVVVDAGWPLEWLDVSGNRLDDAALLAIASAPSLGKLEHLGLGFGQYTQAGLTALAKSKTLGSLRSLDLTSSALGPKNLKVFLAALALPKLEALTLEATGLGDDGVMELAKSPAVRQLTSLELGENKVTQKGVFALADSPHLGGLQRLLLNDAWLHKKAVVEYLAASPTLSSARIYVKGTLLGRAKAPVKPAVQPKKPKKKTK